MDRINQDFHIPTNIAKWIGEHDGVNLAVNWNSASADCGYAHVIWHTVIITVLTRACNRCGYDVIWNPDDSESKCLRHTYNAWRYDTVFAWSSTNPGMSLEEAFDDWLEKQPDNVWQPIVKEEYGQFDWR